MSPPHRLNCDLCCGLPEVAFAFCFFAPLPMADLAVDVSLEIEKSVKKPKVQHHFTIILFIARQQMNSSLPILGLAGLGLLLFLVRNLNLTRPRKVIPAHHNQENKETGKQIYVALDIECGG